MKKLIIYIILNILCLSMHGERWEGMGTEENPYLISTAQQLVDLAEEVNNGNDFQDEFFSLTDDIDLSEVCCEALWNWTPIGNVDYNFNGTFMGNNHTVSNLYINIPSNKKYCGLFGVVGSHGSIHDLILQDGYAYITFWSGGIAGSNSGLISNCKNIGCMVDSWSYSGGICAANFNTITGCVNQADVNASLCSGGICAYNYGTIVNYTNQNGITSNEVCGGICGYNGGFSGISNCDNVEIGFIDNCQNLSSILGNEMTGGIAGRNDGFIVNAINRGGVIGSFYVGGLVGYNGGFDGVTGNITNSFNIGSVLGREYSIGGIAGYGNENSEINNVCTISDVRCVSAPSMNCVGDMIGVKNNCFDSQENLYIIDSIIKQLNLWISEQPDSSAYIKWNYQNVFQINQDSIFSKDDIRIFTGERKLYIISSADRPLYIYTVDGKMVRKMNLRANIMSIIPIDKGVYVAGGRKVVVH